MKVEIQDIIAILLIGGCVTLKALGHNNVIDTILAAIAAVYFGSKLKYGYKT